MAGGSISNQPLVTCNLINTRGTSFIIDPTVTVSRLVNNAGAQ